MASTKCKPKSTVTAIKYQKYTEVNNLSANELKAVCLRHHISNTLPRTARVIFLCHVLGISTVGSDKPGGLLERGTENLTPEQVEDLKKLGPIHLLRLKTWSKDITTLPDIDENVVKKYLLGCQLVDSSSVKRYRLSRAYQLKPFVHSVNVTPHPDYPSFFCILARCNPSQSSQAEDVKVIIIVLDQITGDPCSAYCTCTVGFSQACGHIGAVLFLLAKWIARGVEKAAPDQACTDVRCEWINPKGAAVKPKRFAEIGEKPETVKRRRTADDFGVFFQRQTNTVRPPSAEEVLQLREELLSATSHLGIIPPAVYSLDASRFRDHQQPILQPQPSSLPTCLSDLSPELAFSSEITVDSTPLPIAFLPHETFADATPDTFPDEVTRFLTSFPYSASDLDQITRITVGQSNNLDWFEQKHGSLTSSNFGRILRYLTTRKADPDKIARDVMGYQKWGKPLTTTSVPSLKYGLRYESVAKTKYASRMKKTHPSLEVLETGLHVHPDLPFLRASPDGIVRCTCHRDKLVEVKCPYTARDMSVRQGIRSKKIQYLDVLPDFSLKLKPGTDYYSQVQGAMAITGIHECDFVVFTKKTMEVITVQFNQVEWQTTELKLCQFFEIYIVPEILTNRLKNPPELVQPTVNAPPTPPVTRCQICATLLPESEDIAEDNSNAAVACDCDLCNCSTEDKWFCWPCAGYTSTMASRDSSWHCRTCKDSCQI